MRRSTLIIFCRHDMLGKGNLFRTTGGPEDRQDNIYHLEHMIALLGPPPKDFLDRTKGIAYKIVLMRMVGVESFLRSQKYHRHTWQQENGGELQRFPR